MSPQNVGFSSAKIRALSGVYTDTYDDGAILHCYCFIIYQWHLWLSLAVVSELGSVEDQQHTHMKKSELYLAKIVQRTIH